jgi:ABC-type molybdate transport system substrate-binding protein
MLGKNYDYQFIYEHSALAASKADTTTPKSYRYVRLPDSISLGNPDLNHHYRKAHIVIPGLQPPFTSPTVRIPATRVAWGLTILKTAPNKENAVEFLKLLFSARGVASQTATGPAPITPPVVSRHDFAQLPRALRPLVDVERREH